MHQDGSYWPLDPMEVVTLWLAVDDSDTDNGCMRVLPRTHRLALHEMIPSDEATPNVLGSGISTEVLASLPTDNAVDLCLKAGDVSVHSPMLVHGSNPNSSGRRRGGLTIRYIPTSTKITGHSNGCCFLFQGQPTPGVQNDYLPFPK